MSSVIRKLIVKRFRSVPQATVELDDITFLVGQNGSGKTNLVDAFSFLSDAMISPLQAVFDKRGGIQSVRNRSSGQSFPPNLGIGVVFGPLNGHVIEGHYAFEVKALPNYGFEVIREQCLLISDKKERIWFDRTRDKFTSSIKDLKPSLDPAALGLPVIGGDERFSPIVRTLSGMKVYSIEPAKLRDFQDPDSGISLKKDGSNAASVLQEISRNDPQDLERICQFLEAIVPHTNKVSPKKHGNKLSLEFVQSWGNGKSLTFEAFNMSDGTLRALGLLTAVYQRPSPSFLVVEEPESTIHPGALGAVLDLLLQAGRKMQVVVTTHSPEVLDAKWIGEKNIRIVHWAEGATEISGISESAKKALQDHLMGAGELLRSNALDASPLFHDANKFESDLFPSIQ